MTTARETPQRRASSWVPPRPQRDVKSVAGSDLSQAKGRVSPRARSRPSPLGKCGHLAPWIQVGHHARGAGWLRRRSALPGGTALPRRSGGAAAGRGEG